MEQQKKFKFKPRNRQELSSLVRTKGIYLGDIDTSLITDMSDLFYESERFEFNGIEKWDTSNVKDMSNMFAYCKNFNQPLNFDTSKVEDMYLMFQGCKSLDKTNINFINQKQNTQKQEEILSI